MNNHKGGRKNSADKEEFKEECFLYPVTTAPHRKSKTAQICVCFCVCTFDSTRQQCLLPLRWVSVTSFIKQDSCWFRLQDCRHTEPLFGLFFCPLACISGSSLTILSWTLQAKDGRLMTCSCVLVGTNFSRVLANKVLDFRELNAVDDLHFYSGIYIYIKKVESINK